MRSRQMNDQAIISDPKSCIFIFDSARLRSHLFFRYLSTSSQVSPIYHPFLPAAMFGREHVSQHLRHSELRQKELDEDMALLIGDETYQSCRESFSRAVSDAEQGGKVPIANEHWFNVLRIENALDLLRNEIQDPAQLGRNPTHLPDDIFNSLQPVILIRHPALVVRSMYRDALKMTKLRAGDEDFDLMCINRPLRILFDYFRSEGRHPVVVDAEDILWRTKTMTENLCAVLGSIDPDGLSDKWEPTSKEEMDHMEPLVVMMRKNILESSGIERPDEKSPEPNIERTFQDWKEQYGDEVADYLRRLAEDNMPHYEYLSQFKA